MRSVLAAIGAALAVTAETATPLTKSREDRVKKLQVVTLLKEMRTQVEKELKQDQEIYDKLACWCHTNKEEKTDAVEVAQQTIERLKSKINELTGKHAQLAAEIKQTKADLASDEQSLAEATKVREKEAADFHKLETDNVQAVAQLKSAITVLSRHNEAAFLQAEAFPHITDIVKSLEYRFPVLEEDSHNALDLLQARPYASQSGEIFGILNSMLESMNSNFADALAQEQKAAADFAALKEAKTDEIKAGRELLENKESEFADTAEKLAQSKQNLDDTEEQLGADQAFLLDLEKRCKANDGEMEARNKVRQQEIQAINETIEILTADDARDVAKRSFSFLQRVQSEKSLYLRNKAAAALNKVAMKNGNPDLAMLATTVQLDAFTKVKKAIDGMVASLKQQQADEVKHKDFCNTEFHANEQATTKSNRKLEGLQSKKDDLEQSIQEFTDTIKTLQAEIGQARVELQRASEDQLEASKEFQQVVKDQQATQAILDKAIDRMDKFYNSGNNNSAFIQSEEGSHQGPPPGLKEGGYEKSKGAGGVLGMLAEIKTDSKEAEMQAVKDHQAAVAAYEEFVRNTNTSVADKQRAVVNNTEDKAAAEKEHVQTQEDIKATVSELENLANYNAQLHKSCDFVLKNFDTRQQARSEEMEALAQAKSILSGAQ